MTDPHRPLKDAFGRFATGVAVASCKLTDGSFRLLTVNSFTSVSLAPPLVSWCVESRASAYPEFMEVDHYAISVLTAGRRDLSDRFAGHAPTPLEPGEYEIWQTGAPILTDRAAGFDCKIQARHKAGDHVILVGEVLRFDSRNARPLVYFASNYHSEIQAS